MQDIHIINRATNELFITSTDTLREALLMASDNDCGDKGDKLVIIQYSAGLNYSVQSGDSIDNLEYYLNKMYGISLGRQ